MAYMDYKEFCKQINLAQTSSASVEAKTARIKELQELMLSDQDKINKILLDIEKSSPESPNPLGDQGLA